MILKEEEELMNSFIDPEDERNMEIMSYPPFPFKKFIILMGLIVVLSILITYIRFTYIP